MTNRYLLDQASAYLRIPKSEIRVAEHFPETGNVCVIYGPTLIKVRIPMSDLAQRTPVGQSVAPVKLAVPAMEAATKADLLALAKERGVDVNPRQSKRQIHNALRRATE